MQSCSCRSGRALCLSQKQTQQREHQQPDHTQADGSSVNTGYVTKPSCVFLSHHHPMFWYLCFTRKNQKALKLIQNTIRTMLVRKKCNHASCRSGRALCLSSKISKQRENQQTYLDTVTHNHTDTVQMTYSHGSWHVTQCVLAAGEGRSCASQKKRPKPNAPSPGTCGHSQTQSESHRHSQMPCQMTLSHASNHMTQCLLAVGQGRSCASHRRDQSQGDSPRQVIHSQKPCQLTHSM